MNNNVSTKQSAAQRLQSKWTAKRFLLEELILYVCGNKLTGYKHVGDLTKRCTVTIFVVKMIDDFYFFSTKNTTFRTLLLFLYII